MKRLLSKLIFKLNGWKVVGATDFPDKCIVISAPHTSNWDFLIGRCYAYIAGVAPKYLIKGELFLPILGSLIKFNGGIPIYRNSKHNIVEQVVNMFNDNTHLILALAPEGTRKQVKKWKSGFYHIADKAGVPILLLKMDYEKKEVGIGGRFFTTGDFEKDMLYLQEEFVSVKGKIPEYYNPKIF